MIVFTPCCLSATSDVNGLALLRVRVPGNFQGTAFDPVTVTHGRFLNEVVIWSDAPVAGDLVSNMRVEDDQGILSSVPDPTNPGHMLSEKIPGYPVIRFFQDTPVDLSVGGVYLNPREPLRFSSIDKSNSIFVPSGFSIAASYQTSAAGVIVRANFNWGTFYPGL